MIWIGLDDTDDRDSPGTGRLARELATWLGERFPFPVVTRHQLLLDARVPMTAKNSAMAVHLRADESVDLGGLAEQVARRVRQAAAPGSDPGLCVARNVPEAVMVFGRRAKEVLIAREEPRALAAKAQLILWGLGGDEGGIIGALAAVGLASSGNDGRFTLCGRVRALSGLQPVSAILAAGVAEVQEVGGDVVVEGVVDTGGRLRPSLVGGVPVLIVGRRDGRWVPVPRD